LPIFGGPPSPDSAVGRCFIGGPAPGPDAEKTCDAAEDDDLRQVCNGNLDRARQAPSGWLRDRSHQCFTKRIDMIAVRDQDGAPAGDTLDLWMLGWANNGIRQSDYAVSAEDITVSSGADVAAAQPGIAGGYECRGEQGDHEQRRDGEVVQRHSRGVREWRGPLRPAG
jgi:hypothetical protein